MTTIELRCDLSGLEGHPILKTPLMRDVVAAHCLLQAIEEARTECQTMVFPSTVINWIVDRAASLMAEKI